MGRAIDMENDISKLKQEVSELKKVLQEILNEVKKKLILELSSLNQMITGLTNAFMEYIDFKKDTKKFEDYLIKKEKPSVRKKSSRKNTSRK